MTLHEFIQRVIDEGIAAAKESYAEGSMKRDGAVAGFEACRGRTLQELAALIDESAQKKADAYRNDRDRYWYHVTFDAEVNWVANVLSAVLQNQGLPPLVTPTMRGFQKAASIVGVADSVQA